MSVAVENPAHERACGSPGPVDAVEHAYGSTYRRSAVPCSADGRDLGLRADGGAKEEAGEPQSIDIQSCLGQEQEYYEGKKSQTVDQGQGTA